jgi:hypothetical protein
MQKSIMQNSCQVHHHTTATSPLCPSTLVLLSASHVQTEELAEEDRHFLSDAYKREVIEHMSVSQLVDTIMINPSVRVSC